MKMRKLDASRRHWTIATLRLRYTFASLFNIASYLGFALLIPIALHIVQAKSAQPGPARYSVETRETSTFYVGKKGKFNIVLLDQYGKKLKAPNDLKVTITVTVLDSLAQAKEGLASRKGAQQTSQQALLSRNRLITLARGQQVVRSATIHRRGEEDESIDLMSYQPGRLHIYVESPGIATGETVVVVLEPKRTKPNPALRPRLAFSDVMIMPISLQDQAEEFKLDIQPVKPEIQTSQGEQIGFFKVELHSARGGQFEEAPQDIAVILRVEDGYATFVPDTLTIPKGNAITRQQTELRTRPGGLITISASTSTRVNNLRVIPVSRSYEFKPGIRSTSLSVERQRESAYANGLDEIELRVEALQNARAITPQEEGMEERKIFLRFIGDSRGVRFENGRGEVSIPKNQQTGTIKVFSARPVSDLKVIAESWNGLREKINSGADGLPIRFSFPWFQLLCAAVGGLVFPLLLRQDRMKLAQGLVIGAVFFGLALFGSVLSDPQKIGPISIALTKLPTENPLASFILGFLGSVLLGVIFRVASNTNLQRQNS